MEKVDLAAPAPEGRTSVCARCFATVAASDTVCPECGAPLNSDAAVPIIDTAVHADLAQANLLRVRGDFEQAEKKCLSILKRFPNDPSAHTMLGDICADRNDPERAVEWYELALDLSPNSAQDIEKLADTKRKLELRSRAATEEQLGLPSTKHNPQWLWILLAGFVIVLLIVVVSLNAKPRPKPAINGVVLAPPDGGNQGSSSPAPQGSASGQGGSTSAPSAGASKGATMEESALRDLLQQRSTEGQRIIGLSEDPRDKIVTVTYSVGSTDDARKIGATLAKDALTQSPETLIVTVRGLENDHLVFVADASRPKLEDAEAAQTQTAGSPSDAWIGMLLQREWTPTPATAATSPATPIPAGDTASTPGDSSSSSTPTH